MFKKKGLIILDIDNTLIDTKFSFKNSNVQKGDIILSKKEMIDFKFDKDTINLFNVHIYKRPYLSSFLSYIFQHFHIAIWTAAEERWMNLIIDKILYKYKGRFLFTWYREHTTPNDRYMKPLKEVFNVYPEFNTSNTLIIDDNYHTTNLRLSHLHIDRFEFNINNSKIDNDLKLIINILKHKNFNPKNVILEYKAYKN